MSDKRKVLYTVEIEMPRQTIEVYAKDAGMAELHAWHMIGLAGLKHYGSCDARESQGRSSLEVSPNPSL